MESQYDRLTTNLRLIKDLITHLGNRDSDSEESLIGLDQIMDKYFNKTTAMFESQMQPVKQVQEKLLNCHKAMSKKMDDQEAMSKEMKKDLTELKAVKDKYDKNVVEKTPIGETRVLDPLKQFDRAQRTTLVHGGHVTTEQENEAYKKKFEDVSKELEEMKAKFENAQLRGQHGIGRGYLGSRRGRGHYGNRARERQDHMGAPKNPVSRLVEDQVDGRFIDEKFNI